MKTVLLCLLALGLVVSAVPVAAAYHGTCQIGYSCQIQPCDQKCQRWHLLNLWRCLLGDTYYC